MREIGLISIISSSVLSILSGAVLSFVYLILASFLGIIFSTPRAIMDARPLGRLPSVGEVIAAFISEDTKPHIICDEVLRALIIFIGGLIYLLLSYVTTDGAPRLYTLLLFLLSFLAVISKSGKIIPLIFDLFRSAIVLLLLPFVFLSFYIVRKFNKRKQSDKARY